MKKKQIYRQIADFTQDWKSAMRKTNVFEENCRVPFSQVVSLTLSYGTAAFLNESTGKFERRTNPDTLNFDYTDKDGDRWHFAIMD